MASLIAQDLGILMLDKISFCRIHPSIGIARVGNSPAGFFIGPEVPGAARTPVGGYKDRGHPEMGIPPRVKRQAARFRIYGYDKQAKVIGELTSEHAEISWTVHLANTKAEGDRFAGTAGEELPLGDRRPPEFWRNRSIQDRASLSIDPGPRTTQGTQQAAEFTGGRFRGIEVALGEIRTDEHGRLLVLGGFGKSGSSNPGSKISNYANNDLWYDDVSDGPVTATVTLKSGKSIRVEPSWVIVGPPDFAPAVHNIVTLYDVALDVAQRHKLKLAPPSPSTLSFTDDIAPIFSRLASLEWVQQGGRGANGASAEFADLQRLSDNTPGAAAQYRESVFARFRNPNFALDSAEAKDQATSNFLPALSGDSGDAQVDAPSTWLSVTRTQYDLLAKWRDGRFDSDWEGSFRKRELQPTPEGLDRAALEACAGGAFYPGIEGGWLLRNPAAYAAAFRLSHEKLNPGDLTRRMACPWQADFFECQWHWWPAQRPDEVLTSSVFRRVREIEEEMEHLAPNSREYRRLKAEREVLWAEREPWARGLPPESFDGDEAMVERWAVQGFVVEEDQNGQPFTMEGAATPAETERGKYDGLNWPEYFHILANIELHSDFMPKAREIAKAFFAGADYDSDENYLPFEYSPEALDRRLQKIYDEFVADMAVPSRMDTGVIEYPIVVRREGDREIRKRIEFDVKPFSKRAILQRLRHRGPFNLSDGAWLQRILSAGPVDEARANLFSVWNDEAGNGRADQNHSNVYETLLRSENIYMPPIASREFIEQGLLPAAFIQPVFQFAVGLFPNEFFPELLGMTLYLEWEATPTLTPVVRHLQGRGIDPHFYSLHVAIDNVVAGHGFLAKEAIKLYLQRTEQEGGSVQAIWERIWNGYVTWATAGDLGVELLELCMTIDHKQIDISYPMMMVSGTILNAGALMSRLRVASIEPATGDALSAFVVSQFKPDLQERLRKFHAGQEPDQALLSAVLDELNLLIQTDRSIFDEDRFAGVALSEEVTTLLKTQKIAGEDLVRLNRLLLRDGYVGLVGGIPQTAPVLFPDYKVHFERRFVEMIKRKARAAKPMHSGVVLGTENLAALFDSPEAIPRALLKAGWINIDHPRSSQFFDLLSFSGPMYKIFTHDEEAVILDWIESLRPTQTQPQPNPDVSPQEWAARVLKFIQSNAKAASKVPQHDAPDLKLTDENGVSRSLQSWFSTPSDLMAALLRNGWVIPGDPAGSKFYVAFDTGPMKFMPVKGLIKDWIASGALLASEPSTETAVASVSLQGLGRASTLLPLAKTAIEIVGDEHRAPAVAAFAGPTRRGFAAKRKLIGMGAVH